MAAGLRRSRLPSDHGQATEGGLSLCVTEWRVVGRRRLKTSSRTWAWWSQVEIDLGPCAKEKGGKLTCSRHMLAAFHEGSTGRA